MLDSAATTGMKQISGNFCTASTSNIHLKYDVLLNPSKFKACCTKSLMANDVLIVRLVWCCCHGCAHGRNANDVQAYVRPAAISCGRASLHARMSQTGIRLYNCGAQFWLVLTCHADCSPPAWQALQQVVYYYFLPA